MAVAKKATVKKPGRALARPGDPFITSKGEKIEPEGYKDGKPAQGINNSTIDPSEFRPTIRRNLKELPAESNVITGVGAVFMYTILGVGDREIAEALRTTVDEVGSVRKHSAYADCFNTVLREFVNANSDLLTSRIAAASQIALTTVVDLSANAKKEETKLSASKDILDRAGVRPKDQEQRSQAVKSDLRIIITENEKTISIDVSNIGDENGDSRE